MSKKRNPILKSWTINAKKWIKTIEKNEIESRRLVTNAAVLTCVLQQNPKKVLDLGCGEGWLVRALSKQKIKVVGIDAIPVLIAKAKKKGKGTFSVKTYEEIITGTTLKKAPFDLVVINFALFEKKETFLLLKSLSNYLTKNGKIVIQTLHPFNIPNAYKSKWRANSWAGLKRDFTQPHQWYARTLTDWIKLFKKANLKLTDLKEPIHPKTKKPASIIFVLTT